MKEVLNKNAWFVLLLPVFFVSHGGVENFGFITVKDCLLLLATYVPITLFLYLLFYWCYRSAAKAALLAALFMSFYLFFGAIYDFLKLHAPPLHRYRILLPLFLILATVVAVYLKKTKSTFNRLTLFLNVLLFVYLLIDITGITWKWMYPATDKFSTYHFSKNNQYDKCDTCFKPDIYFLLFDEYGSSLSLKENYGFSNNLDSFLAAREFHIQTKAYSNYHLTCASMASMLNISYINGLQEKSIFSVEDYGRCQQLIKNNEVIKFLSQQGYSIANYSAFDLVGNPTPVVQVILPLNTRLITDKTLLSRMYRSIGYMAATWLDNKFLYRAYRNNETLLKMTAAFSAVKKKQPAFVYGHFNLPHDPYYLDKNGRMKEKTTLINEGSTEARPTNSYLSYVEYTNVRIKKLVDTILSNTGGKAVIILMGDHGFRKYIDSNMHRNYQCMNAVYLPGKNYQLLYDSISSVNQFRVLFNTLFKQSIPLLKDSTVCLYPY